MSNLRIGLYFVMAGTAWGVGFLFIKIAVQGVSPAQFVFARVLIASVVLLTIVFATKRKLPRGIKAWGMITILGIFGVYLPFLFYAHAGQRIPSALSAMYNSSVPVVTVLLTLLVFKQEKLSTRKFLGIIIGLIGITILLQPWSIGGGSFDLLGQIFALGAVVLLAFAFVFTRRAITPLKLDPVSVAAAQVLVATVFGALFLPFTDFATITLSPAIILSLLAIGVTSTGFAYIWNFSVIEHWGAATASMSTYVTTIAGVFAGILFANEVLVLHQLIGALIVLLGVAVGTTNGNMFKKRN